MNVIRAASVSKPLPIDAETWQITLYDAVTIEGDELFTYEELTFASSLEQADKLYARVAQTTVVQ